jgi:serine/threonine protein kinase
MSKDNSNNNTQIPVSTYLQHYQFHPLFLQNYIIGEELGSGGYGFVVSAKERSTGIERAVKFIFRNKIPQHSWVKDRELGIIPMEIYILKNVNHPSIISYIDSYQDDHFCYLIMELHGTQWSSAVNKDMSSANARSPALSETTTSYSSASDSESDCEEENNTYCPPTPTATSANNQYFDVVTEEDQPIIKRRTSCDLFECIERHNNFEEPLAKMIFKQIASCVAHLDLIGVCHRDIKDENIVIDDQFQVRFFFSLIKPSTSPILNTYKNRSN